MFNLIIKYSSNNIFLTALINNKKIYFKSTGQFLEYKKGKRKISNFALLCIINNFLNFYFLNFKKKILSFIFIRFFGCTIRRFFFLKYHFKLIFKKLKFKYLLFLDSIFPAFNGCRLKKKKRKKKRRKKKSNI